MQKIEICRVCDEPLTYGPHKHKYQYCPICEKETVHIVPIFGFPWHCKETHPLDSKQCSVCFAPMPVDEFGAVCVGPAVKRICSKCDPLQNGKLRLVPVGISFGKKP